MSVSVHRKAADVKYSFKNISGIQTYTYSTHTQTHSERVPGGLGEALGGGDGIIVAGDQHGNLVAARQLEQLL